MKPLLAVTLISLFASLASPSATAADLAYKKEGNGPGVVLIHGLGGNREAWTEVSKRMKKDHTVMSLDLPGHGGSNGIAPPMKEGAADLDAIGADIAKLIRKLKIEPVLLVGHSIGGAIAVRVALADPKAVRGIILVDSTLSPLPKSFTDKFLKDLDTNAGAAMEEFFGGLCKGEAQKTRLLKEASKVQLPMFKAYVRALGGDSLGTRATAIQVPVTLFASTVLPDPTKEKEALKQLGYEGIPKFNVSYFVEAWHWIMWDDPDTFEILFNDFENNVVLSAGGNARSSRSR